MLTKSILKIWLLSVLSEIHLNKLMGTDQSQHFKYVTVRNIIDPSMIHKLIEMNFSKLTDDSQIFRNDFDCIYYITSVKYHLKLLSAKFFGPYDFLEMNSKNIYYLL